MECFMLPAYTTLQAESRAREDERGKEANSMNVIRSFLLITLGFFIAVSLGLGKAEYGKKEGKACTFCHPAGKFKELTDAGKFYKDHNHSLEGYKAPDKEEKK